MAMTLWLQGCRSLGTQNPLTEESFEACCLRGQEYRSHGSNSTILGRSHQAAGAGTLQNRRSKQARFG